MSREPSAIEETVLAPADAVAATHGRETPLVLRGLCADWPLVRASGDAAEVRRYLLSGYERAPVTAFLAEAGSDGRLFYNDDVSGLNFQQVRTTLDEVLRRIDEAAAMDPAPTIYMGSMAMDHCVPAIRPDNSLPTGDLPTTIRIWIGNRSRVATHHDVMDNIACVCVGERQFTLFPPEQTANLYLGPIDLTPAGQQVSMVDPEHPDLERFPRYAEALAASQRAVLRPGDAIYIPSMWWHQVDAHSTLNVLINHWWRDVAPWMGAPGDVLLHALLNLRDLPARQREAWKHLFDHYVFDPPDDALAHLPARSRGALGELDEAQARQLRGLLRNRLNR